MKQSLKKTPLSEPLSLDLIEVGLGIVFRSAKVEGVCQGGGTPPPIEALLSQRRAETVYPHWWEFPGGKIEPGESVEACVERELREELGIRIRLLDAAGAIPSITHRYEHGLVRLHPRLATLAPDSPSPANLEVAAHRWVRIEELKTGRLLPANAPLLEALRRWALRTPRLT